MRWKAKSEKCDCCGEAVPNYSCSCIPTASCPNLLLAGGGPPIKGGGEYRSTCDEGWPNEDGLAMAEEVGCLAMAEKHRNKKRCSRKHGGGGGAGKGGGASNFDFDFDLEHNLMKASAAMGGGGSGVVPLKKVAGIADNAGSAVLATSARISAAPQIKACKPAAEGESSY